MNLPHAQLLSIVQSQPYPLLFATISGAHLYGFPSPNSDFDLRGVHVLPTPKVVGLETEDETIQAAQDDEFELDLVTHDAKKFFLLMLKKNGYVMEQLYSPLIVFTTPEHEELKAIGKDCLTRFHAHHYLGFSETQWKLLSKENPPRLKPLLYLYRVLLTGIFLMQNGRIEANLEILNEEYKLPFLPQLIEQKKVGEEKQPLSDSDLSFHEREYQRLRFELEQAMQKSALPDAPSGRDALNDLLVRVRLSDQKEKALKEL